MPAKASAIAAPALGGALLAFGSWRALFWITVLYGALSLFAAWRILKLRMARQEAALAILSARAERR